MCVCGGGGGLLTNLILTWHAPDEFSERRVPDLIMVVEVLEEGLTPAGRLDDRLGNVSK